MDSLRSRLLRERAALLVVDIQERMIAAMDPARLARLLNRTAALLAGARALGVPVVVTEQYPKGLGVTVPEVRAALPPGAPVVEKLDFSCAVPRTLELIAGRPQVLVCGMETHVCVFQTVRDLAERGMVPFVCADAVLSRNAEDRQFGLERCREVGAVLTTVESALFDLLQRAGTPEFKAVSAAVK